MKVLIQNHFIIENKMKICSINNCDKQTFCKNLCQKHYTQMYRYGKVSRTQNDPNEIIIGNKICEMYLYNNRGKYISSTFFDIEFLVKIKKYKWYITKKHRNTYYVKTNLKNQIKHKQLGLHQLILPCKKPFMADHKDGNGLNNRLNNLKKVTNRQNLEHRKDNTSGYPGVIWNKKYKIYTVYITWKKKAIYLGAFNDALDGFNIRQKFKKEHNIL